METMHLLSTPANAAALAKAVAQDRKDQAKHRKNNLVMQAFLSFMEGQMAAHPELIEPVTTVQMAQIAALVEGVEPVSVQTVAQFERQLTELDEATSVNPKCRRSAART